jgi:uncharacterized protein
VSETMSETAGKVVWFELPAADSGRARDFYGSLFGWQFEAYEGQDYHLANEAGGAIQGASGQTGLIVYFGTSDIDASIKQVQTLGGEAGDRQEIPGIGSYALCTDTEGNSFGLYQGGGSA